MGGILLRVYEILIWLWIHLLNTHLSLIIEVKDGHAAIVCLAVSSQHIVRSTWSMPAHEDTTGCLDHRSHIIKDKRNSMWLWKFGATFRFYLVIIKQSFRILCRNTRPDCGGFVTLRTHLWYNTKGTTNTTDVCIE